MKHGYKPSGIDLLTTVTNYTYSQSAAIEKLIQAGADPNAAVPEHLTDGFRYIDFSRSDVLVPVIVQSYRGVAMYRTEEIIKTFATLVRNGGDLSLLSSEEKATIAELVKDNPKFTDIYELVK